MDDENPHSLSLSSVLSCLSFRMGLFMEHENKSIFSSTVRIQEERGHEVIQTGPYAIVRHPGYLGAIMSGISMAFALGLLWAVIPAIAMMILFIIRTSLIPSVALLAVYFKDCRTRPSFVAR